MNTFTAKQILYYKELYQIYDELDQKLKELKRDRDENPYFYDYYTHEINKIMYFLAKNPNKHHIKTLYQALVDVCPHDVVNVDHNYCMLCEKKIEDNEITDSIRYKRLQERTSTSSVQKTLKKMIQNHREKDIDIKHMINQEFYRFRKILFIGGMMRDNPLLYDEEEQYYIYEWIKTLAHLYMKTFYDVTIIGTKRAGHIDQSTKQPKHFFASNNEAVANTIATLKDIPFDYVIDTLQYPKLKNEFPNAHIIHYYNENTIDNCLLNQLKDDTVIVSQNECLQFQCYHKQLVDENLSESEMLEKVKKITFEQE